MGPKAAYGPKNVDIAPFEPMELAFGQGIVGRGGSHCRTVQHGRDADYVVDDARRGSEMAVPIVKMAR